ncbi:hypothetical protein HDU77_008920 [Chytriomyces hyalinus]|nr:hypothetical protein HDU77_008920 [Chytriomyces hyalinus]
MATDSGETDCDRVLRVPFLRDAIPMGAQCCQFKDNTVQNSLVIQCDDAGRITVLQYDGYGREFKLSGDLSVFGQLTELTALNVPNNAFYGPLPSFKTWRNLKSLSARDSGFFGVIPTQLGKLASLSKLDVSSNELSGPIPSELAQMRSLEALQLNGNQLSGSIPSEMATMQHLVKCSLHNNFLSGSIPSSFEHRANHDMVFNVGNNTLSGPYPSNSGPLDTLNMNCFDGQSPRNSACPEVQETRGGGFKVPSVAIGCGIFGLVAILVVGMIFKRRRQQQLEQNVPSTSPSIPKRKSIPLDDEESIQIQVEQHRVSMESLVKIIEQDRNELHPHENKQGMSMLNVLLTDAGPIQNYSHEHKKNPENILALQELEGTDPKKWTVQQTATWCASVISSSSSIHDTVVAKGISGRELIEMSRIAVCTGLGLVFGDAVVLQDLLLKAVERHGRIGLPAYDDA